LRRRAAPLFAREFSVEFQCAMRVQVQTSIFTAD
jgi:hypothetical protein